MTEESNRNGTVKSTRTIYTTASYKNITDYNTQAKINDINTAMPVKVVRTDDCSHYGFVGYVDVLPLVTGVSGFGEAVQPAALYHLPYFRLQGGMAAVICDPQVGDIGIAVFCQRDTANVTAGTKEPQQPRSARKYDMADGFYIGGFFNKPPSGFIENLQDRKITIQAAGGIEINGDVRVNGDVVANGISLKNHTHTGDSGGTTGKPK